MAEIANGSSATLGAQSVVVKNASITFNTVASSAKKQPRKTWKRRSNRHQVHALKSISFTAHEGETIGVVGVNGSGKTTLMKAVSGLLTLTDGEIYATAKPTFLGIGASLVNELSGSKNIILGCLAMGMTYSEALDLHDSIAEFSGIGKAIEFPMRTYSSGMSARLRFGIATSMTQEILIVDEALAVGDGAFRARAEARIKKLREAAGTVFLVSHQLRVLEEQASRILWLKHGELVADGPTEDVLPEYKQFLEDQKDK